VEQQICVLPLREYTAKIQSYYVLYFSVKHLNHDLTITYHMQTTIYGSFIFIVNSAGLRKPRRLAKHTCVGQGAVRYF
jgi:hypothetical protein